MALLTLQEHDDDDDDGDIYITGKIGKYYSRSQRSGRFWTGFV